MSISDQSVSLEYSGFSNIILKPKPIKVEDYTRTHLPEIAAHHHLFQDLITAASQALLQICIEFTLHKKAVCCSRIPSLSLDGWILGIITRPLLIFYTIKIHALLCTTILWIRKIGPIEQHQILFYYSSGTAEV